MSTRRPASTRSPGEEPLDDGEEDDPTARWVPGWLATTIYIVLSVLTVALVVLHTLDISGFKVDTTTLGLLAVLLVVPLAPNITKVKAGNAEVEIGRREAKRLQAVAAELPAGERNVAPPGELMVDELIRRDPPLGLAKLRIDLERELSALYVERLPEAAVRFRPISEMARDLTKSGDLPAEINAPLLDVNTLANRAVHGEYVPADVAEDIAQIGVRVLAALKSL